MAGWQKIQRGWYELTDGDGQVWRVIQAGSEKWECIRPGYGELCHPWATMADAKWYIEKYHAAQETASTREP